MSENLQIIQEEKERSARHRKRVYTPIVGREYIIDGNNQKHLIHIQVDKIDGVELTAMLMQDSVQIQGGHTLSAGLLINFSIEDTKFYSVN